MHYIHTPVVVAYTHRRRVIRYTQNGRQTPVQYTVIAVASLTQWLIHSAAAYKIKKKTYTN